MIRPLGFQAGGTAWHGVSRCGGEEHESEEDGRNGLTKRSEQCVLYVGVCSVVGYEDFLL